MDTLEIEEIASTSKLQNAPKMSSEIFEMKNNYYVVTDGVMFNYYPIKVVLDDETSPIIRIEKSPPVLLEGLAVINRQVFKVTLQDLHRRIIRKSRKYNLEVLNGTTSTSSSTDTGTENGIITIATNIIESTVQHTDESAVSSDPEVEIGSAADLAWEEQIRTLLSTLSTKEGFGGEEWEISSTA